MPRISTRVFTANIANALTILRIILAPIAALCLWWGGGSPLFEHSGDRPLIPDWTLTAFVLILIAALTDWLDGLAARAFDAHSRLGRLLDPLADKVLCWSLLLAFAAVSDWHLAILVPGLLIIGRDLIISLQRLTASDGEGPKPSPLAKFKTALELVVLGVGPLVALAGAPPIASMLWLGGLALSAALSLWTGLVYLQGK